MQRAEELKTQLMRFEDPLTGKALGEALSVKQDEQGLVVELGFPVEDQAAYAEALNTYLADQGLDQSVRVQSQVLSHQVQNMLKPLPGVSNIIAVSSAKGGVGKSTTSANLALALVADGAKVGVLDADIYGPSQPKIFGLKGRPDSPDGKSITPMINHDTKVMSIGFLVEEDTPMVWRGPMVTGALQQLLSETSWGELDYLVIDLPPGTGDIQLTMSQKIPVSGAVVVTTPQDLALLDAIKGVRMFEKVNIPILGLVENMATHVCTQCGHNEAIFGEGGAAAMAEREQLELLGQLPLSMPIREAIDAGTPSVVSAPDSVEAQAYRKIARAVAINLAQQARDFAGRFPKIVVQ